MHIEPAAHTRHDVVIVGARVAGAATAMLLARSGLDVVVLDRSPLPSDTTSTHSLVRGGVVQLSRWGLLEDVLDSGAPAIRSVSFRQYGESAPAPVSYQVKERAGVDLMLAPRRLVLDDILTTSARRAGATVLDRTTVTDLVRNASGRVTGVLAHTAQGRELRLDATVVIGADGLRSGLARKVGARVLEQHAPSGACLYAYVGDVAWDGFDFHIADGAFAGVFPTHGGEAAVWLMLPAASANGVLRAGDRKVDAWLAELEVRVPVLGTTVRSGAVRSPLRGTVGLPNHVLQPHGPGWALVGDAGFHRDPITGHGITDAFRDADLLATAVVRALASPQDERAAYDGYRRERDSAIVETFRITRELGAFPPIARFVELQMELSRALDEEARLLAARPTFVPVA
ncbi:NAD(P)/FAD-dependent oxidoreductase [Nocardioides agariphilus]|jgi:flavin-dependent dehydrogenase|uniref:NAD(P)/FAD-dependent oxidoreductase n=1 Tax=Nocardioides agariphilus TaxID=433664 RepID=A0A930YNT9_9ACTN|nr:NAD(P)/FAD-dependent oxidoreductase [Nocardioides agariphilus]MBF4767025.1 NAD(P)/FAD-dependent oxidoreductase [Nocardioides agariphilus]